MASIVFAAGVAAIAGPPSGIAATFATGVAVAGAGALGGLLDAQYTYPALFGSRSPQFTGPNFDDFQVQTASEGSGIKRVYGEIAVAGIVIWHPEWTVTHGETGGGKGGGGDSVSTKTVTQDAGVLICKGPVNAINKVWADAKLIYDATRVGTTVQVVSSQLTIETHEGGLMKIKSETPPTGPDLTTQGFVIGDDLTVSGYTEGANNGTWKILNVWEDTDGDGETFILLDNTGHVNEALGDSVTLSQTINDAVTDDRYTSITFYTGTTTQTPDSLMETVEGAGNVPGFRGFAYMVIEQLQLADFGNRLPSFTFQVEQHANATVADVITSILTDAGLSSGQFDVTDVEDVACSGYAISGLQTPTRSIEPLLLAYDLVAQDIDGVLTFTNRSSQQTVTIQQSDLGVQTEGQDVPGLAISDVGDFSLVRQVNVTFIDAAQEYQQGHVSARSETSATSVGASTVNIPVVLTPDEAQAISARLLANALTRRQRATWVTTPAYIHIVENDLVQVEQNGETYTIEVHHINRGANWVLEMSGPVIESQTYAQTGDVDDLPDVIDGPNTVPDVTLYVLDVPALHDTNYSQEGYYVAVHASDYNASWPGAVVYLSTNDGRTYKTLDTLPSEVTAGVVNSAFGTATGYFWDRTTEIVVTLHHGTLTSATEIAVLNGANCCICGNEVLAFQTVTSLGNNKYRLSKLIRGLRDTRDHMDEHFDGERFVLLTNEAGASQPVVFMPLNFVDIGSDWDWKALAIGGGDLNGATNVEEVLDAENIKPFAPTNVQGERDGSGNLTISWERVSRAIASLTDFPDPPPMVDTFEDYEVDILDSGVPVRTLSVSGATELTYTAAQQTTDFGSPQSSIDVAVYQKNDYGIRGNAKAATL